MKKHVSWALSVLLMVAFVPAQITIDGDMSDWLPYMQVDFAPNPVEEAGDYPAAPELDMENVWMTNDADYLYIRIDINENGIFDDLQEFGGMMSTHEIFLDTDLDTGTGLTWGWWATGADYWILLNVPHGIGWVEGWAGEDGWQEAVGIARFVGASGADSQWEDTFFGCDVAINDDDNMMEIAIPREAIGETGALENTRVMLLGENTTDWSGDTYPNDVGVETMDYIYNSSIVVDGDYGDWDAGMQLDVAPNPEEVAGDFGYPELDMIDIFATHDWENIYFRVDMGGPVADIDFGTELFELYLDTDQDNVTGLTWGWWATGGDYFIPLAGDDHEIQEFAGASGSDATFLPTGVQAQVVVGADGQSFEIAVPRDAVGETGLFEGTRVFFYATETVTWGADMYPNDLGAETADYLWGTGGAVEPPPMPDGDILIDGDMNEWLPEWQFDVDPNPMEEAGDYPDDMNLDLQDIYVYHDADWLYLRVDLNDSGSFDALQAGQSVAIYLDTDMSNATGLTWGTWAAGAEFQIDISASGGVLQYTGTGADWSWETTGFMSWLAANTAANKMEVAIPLEALGVLGNGLNVAIVGQNNEAALWSHDSYPSDLDVELATYWFVPEGYFVDGNVGEWLAEDQLDVAPNPIEEIGDFAVVDLDLKDVYAASDEDNLYLRVDMHDDAALSALGAGQAITLYLDDDMDAATGLTWGWWGTGADYMVTITGTWHGIYHYTGATGGEWSWEDAGVLADVAVGDDNKLEISIPLTLFTAMESGINIALGAQHSDWTTDTYPSDLGGTVASYLLPVECTNNGDTNMDGGTDILDVVWMVGVILGTISIENDCQAIAGDVNIDGSIDILDVVQVVDWILNPLARAGNATSATFQQNDHTLSLSANGYIGAVLVEMKHQPGFDLQLTSDALIADSHTDGTHTTVLVVGPAAGDLFTGSNEFEILNIQAATGDGYIPVSQDVPQRFALDPAFPNPFNPATTCNFQMSDPGQVQISIYDVQGRVVDQYNLGQLNPGYHDFTWNAAQQATGVYFLHLTTGNNTAVQKVLLVK